MENPVISLIAVCIQYLICYGPVTSGTFISVFCCFTRGTVDPLYPLLVILDHFLFPS